MNKFNKKGFTLIEMLVVIAIIAVLVSIIIPTVSNATTKAAAAADAANLRSLQSELTIAYMTGTPKAQGKITTNNAEITVTSTGVTVTVDSDFPTSKYIGGTPATAATATYAAATGFTCVYGSQTIATLSAAAGN